MVKKMKIKKNKIIKNEKFIASTLKDINKTMKLSKAIIQEDIQFLKILGKY